MGCWYSQWLPVSRPSLLCAFSLLVFRLFVTVSAPPRAPIFYNFHGSTRDVLPRGCPTCVSDFLNCAPPFGEVELGPLRAPTLWMVGRPTLFIPGDPFRSEALGGPKFSSTVRSGRRWPASDAANGPLQRTSPPHPPTHRQSYPSELPRTRQMETRHQEYASRARM